MVLTGQILFLLFFMSTVLLFLDIYIQVFLNLKSPSISIPHLFTPDVSAWAANLMNNRACTGFNSHYFRLSDELARLHSKLKYF